MEMELKDIEGVWPELADLMTVNAWTVERVATAYPRQLEAFPGVGPVTANRIIYAARAMVAEAEINNNLCCTVADSVRCVWNTRLIILAEHTPTGTRYEFMPGQTQEVDPADAGYLLSLEREQVSCCSGSPPSVLRMFEEV